MKTITTAMLLALSFGAIGQARAANGPTAHTPLRGADCIDTSRINDWHIVDQRSAIVRTGPKYYRVTLQNSCPQLSHPPGLIFNSGPGAGANQGRICGSVGETVHSRGQPACPIQAVSSIDKATYGQLGKDAEDYRKHHPKPSH